MNLVKLYIIFLKIGAQLIGGGYVILPLLRPYFIEKNKLISEEELIDYFALSQCLPGIIAVNISILIGYKARRSLGAITAILGLITSPFIIILALANVILFHINSPILQNAFWGIRLAIVILLFLTLKEMWENSIKDKFSLIMFFLAIIVTLFSTLSPAIIIVSGGLVGLLYAKFKKLNTKEQK